MEALAQVTRLKQHYSAVNEPLTQVCSSLPWCFLNAQKQNSLQTKISLMVPHEMKSESDILLLLQDRNDASRPQHLSKHTHTMIL